jgi:hypothetical protein
MAAQITPNINTLPDDASWDTPYVWNSEEAKWERVPKVTGHLIVDGEEVAFDDEASYMAASQIPEVTIEGD